ncbi:hypothetical protein [Tepidiforma sp.]|uniref:hypothetical protein n=1 Tax=Tepidiforma sp. TaxID=2682230 RepID=UPI00261A1CCB|nr:hypothetical protein [Tepidiforma sp.]
MGRRGEDAPRGGHALTSGGQEAEVARWLDDLLGPGHGRRVIAIRDDRVLVSKVSPGLPARVVEAVTNLSALFDPAALRDCMPPGLPPAKAWHAAASAIVREAKAAGRLDGTGAAEVLAGIDSAAALLASCCWTGGDAASWRPSDAERSALDDAEARLARGARGLFTRVYGTWEGRPVENHCPGAEAARALFAAARAALEGDGRAGPACPGDGRPVR